MARTMPIRLRSIFAACIVIVSCLIIYNVYTNTIGSSNDVSQALPIISADSKPFRVVPDDPGGMNIPHQDSRLFELLKTDNGDPLALDGVVLKKRRTQELESLNEGHQNEISTGFVLPEVPEIRTESLYGVVEDLKLRETVTTPLEKPQIPFVKEVEAESKSTAMVSVIVSMPTPSKKPDTSIKAKVAKPIEQDNFVPVQTQSYYMQLASLRDGASARQMYENIARDLPEAVVGVPAAFPIVDLGERGIFTRIQIGPMSQKEAKRRCKIYTSSSSNGGTCLVISR